MWPRQRIIKDFSRKGNFQEVAIPANIERITAFAKHDGDVPLRGSLLVKKLVPSLALA